MPTVIDSFYLVTLGTYRFLYILNWIVRGAKERHIDPTSWVWGTLQTALIIDFAWVYWTRQRVKLRHGGVVDSEDFGRGWLINRFGSRKSVDFDYDEEERGAPRNLSDHRNNSANGNKWGPRGISVSADEGLLGHDARGKQPRNGSVDPEQQPLADPAAFEDESDDEAPPPAAATASNKHASGVRGDEWNDDVDEDAQEHNGVAK